MRSRVMSLFNNPERSERKSPISRDEMLPPGTVQKIVEEIDETIQIEMLRQLRDRVKPGDEKYLQDLIAEMKARKLKSLQTPETPQRSSKFPPTPPPPLPVNTSHEQTMQTNNIVVVKGRSSTAPTDPMLQSVNKMSKKKKNIFQRIWSLIKRIPSQIVEGTKSLECHIWKSIKSSIGSVEKIKTNLESKLSGHKEKAKEPQEVQKTEAPAPALSATEEFSSAVNHLIAHLRSNGAIKEEGIFRLSGEQGTNNKLLAEIRKNSKFVIPPGTDIHSVTGVLKRLFRELEPKIFNKNEASLAAFLAAGAMQNNNEAEIIAKLNIAISTLPEMDKKVLKNLVHFLREVSANSKANLMANTNLATCFGPNMADVEMEDCLVLNNAFKHLLDHADQIFPKDMPDDVASASPAA